MATGHGIEPIRVDEQHISPSLNRLLDIFIAVCALVSLSPLMVLAALAVAIESGTPVLFSQPRLGLGGKPFRIYKFRKFHRDAGRGSPLTFKNDSRMTRVGRFLGKSKLDELPQLWNVLKGDMSIVGPRPETFDFEDCFVDEYRHVLDFKPGLLGPSQVFFRNEASLYPVKGDANAYYRKVLFPLKANIDLAYFSKRTLWSDLAWVVCGCLAVCGWRPLPPEMLCRTE